MSAAVPIAAFAVQPRELGVVVPFAISKETLPAARFALLSVTDAEGRTGLGEASPFPSLTGDTMESAVATARDLAAELHGQTPLQALTRLEAHRPEIQARSRTAYAGIESALFDLHARQLGVPLAALWGTAALPSVETDITLPIMAPGVVPGFWEKYANHGFRTVKIKVSGNVAQDYDMVMALVGTVPPGTSITLDGNQGYTESGAVQLVQQLAKDGVQPQFFEQPLPETDWAGYARLIPRLPIPVCLDETVQSVAAAMRCVNELPPCLINLKIMKSGVREALAILAVARAAGRGLMIGGMLETEVAMGLSLQMAAGTGAITFVDLDTPFFLAERVTKTSPWHAGRARLNVPSSAGIGMELSS